MVDTNAEWIASWETAVEKAFGLALLGMGTGLGVYKTITACQEMRRVRHGTATQRDEEALDGYIRQTGVEPSSVMKQLASLLKHLPKFKRDPRAQQEIHNLEDYAERPRSPSPPGRDNGEGPSRPRGPAPMPSALPHRPAKSSSSSSSQPRKKRYSEMSKSERQTYTKGDDTKGWYTRNNKQEKRYCLWT